FERDEKVGRAGVALARATSAELAVDAAGLVTVSADDMESAEFGDTRAEFNVSTAADHVGRNGNGSPLTGPSDNLGLLLVVLGIENGVRNAHLFKHAREKLADLNGDGTDENRTAFGVN